MQLSTAVIALTAAASVGAVSSPAVHAQSASAKAQNTKPKAVKIRVVHSGDTLGNIATNFGTTYQRLYDANTFIKHPDLIYPGDKVRIPAATERLSHRSLPGEVASARPALVERASVTPAPTPAPVQPVVHRSYVRSAPVTTASASGSTWDRLAQCESSGNWAANTGNGFYGGLQFTLSSWRAVGGQGLPSQASKAEQIARAQQLQAMQGWGAWPVCSSQAGLR